MTYVIITADFGQRKGSLVCNVEHRAIEGPMIRTKRRNDDMEEQIDTPT